MNNIRIYLLFLLGCLLDVVSASSQIADTVSSPVIHRIGLDFSPGYVLPTNALYRYRSDEVSLLKQSASVHLKYGFQFSPSTRLGRMYPNCYQGIGIAYQTFFDSDNYGEPLLVYAFQHARICRISNRLGLDYEWDFGLSTGWKPYHKEHNPLNKVVGSKMNAYINLNFLFDWHLNKDWSLDCGVGLTHFSNGNTHSPNAGVNIVSARIGVSRVFDSHDCLGRRASLSGASESLKSSKSSVSSKTSEQMSPHISYDLVVYGATRIKAIIEQQYLVPGVFGVVGLNFSPMFNFNRYFKAGVSADVQWDESANIQYHEAGVDEEGYKRFYWPPFREQFSVGLSLRGELVMPFFSVNIGFGHNLLYQGSDLDGFYQMAVLKTSLTRNLYLHVGYQLKEFHTPKNLMLGFGYRFHNKRK